MVVGTFSPIDETHLPDDTDSTKRRKLLETILRTNKVLQTIKFDLFDASGKPMQLIDSSDSAITTSVRSAVSRNTTLTSLSLHEGLPDAIQAQLDGNFFRSNSLVAVEDDYETRRTIVEMVVEADSYADRRPLANRVYQLLRQKPSVLLNCSRQLQD
ncbi:expressed unknown protein [Seminavis robusta]|uniref:Uncharacterized protein n=1 Tax=Seminavis robusta TaxID=568900 RepID=A0A9N8D6P4_9STRA|nr:expressed unknown protein [Seminavis robusta]|eukprot:Sro14_g010630.1 n/a (157) ;mRNA; f:99455-99925